MKRATVCLLVLLSGVSCLDSRERLDPPRIYLNLDGTGVASGGEIAGRVSAADMSGLVYVQARLLIEGDPAGPKSSYASGFEQDSLDYDFHFTVKSGFPSGTRLFVTGTVRDNQNFEVAVTDTSFIR